MAVAALNEGDIFADRYTIVRELASGGMGTVYEVVHTVTHRHCALKVMLSHTVEREKLRQRFMQESRLAAQIGSEYIVDVLDAGVDEETKAPYLVMELLEGEDLGQRLLRLGPLSRDEAVSYLWHVALALDRTHQAGIVHRDLKASNLFLTRREDGTPLVKVLDFGVAKVLTMENSNEQRTQTVGTPIYMAPEQFRSEGRVSPATDIYALGMLAYTLLVGVHYWSEEHERCENPFAFASVAVHGPKEPPSARAAREDVELPIDFDSWFTRATARWPQDRFVSATSAIVALAECLGIDTPVVPLSLPPPPPSHVSTTDALAATIESPSGRLSNPGLRTGSTGGMGGRHDSGREQHTEVSLSVTSGGAPLVIAEEESHRRPGRVVALVAGVAIAAGVALAGIGRYRASREAPRVEPASTATSAVAAEPSSVSTSRVQNMDQEPNVTSIDELPFAPPEPGVQAPSRVTPEPGRRPPPSGAARNRRRGTAAERREPAAAPTEPSNSESSEPTTPDNSGSPKPAGRENLYRRN
jgi:eukaryotic-like serine/threonine-protein kinase